MRNKHREADAEVDKVPPPLTIQGRFSLAQEYLVAPNQTTLDVHHAALNKRHEVNMLEEVSIVRSETRRMTVSSHRGASNNSSNLRPHLPTTRSDHS
jgi:hypothetical protein